MSNAYAMWDIPYRNENMRNVYVMWGIYHIGTIPDLLGLVYYAACNLEINKLYYI
jgi:hypothetical protein